MVFLVPKNHYFAYIAVELTFEVDVRERDQITVESTEKILW